MKIIFLDIDGVLNSDVFYDDRYNRLKSGQFVPEHPYCEFCKDNVDNLNYILAETGAEIVVSSTWRFHDDINKVLRDVGVSKDIIGITPSCSSRVRGAEIYMYLSEHYNDNIDDYVILDDDCDMLLEQKAHFFWIDGYTGLDMGISKRIVEYLKHLK